MNAKAKRKSNLITSFKFAFQGISEAVLNERNVQIHLWISCVVIILGWSLAISRMEWIAILFAIGGMLALELMNTAIERTVDLYTKDFHPLAKSAKDLGAGAVLLFAIFSVIVGLIVFLPKLIAF